MHARWRFRLVARDLRGTYVMEEVRPLEISGTDLQALEQARKLMTEYLVRVEAVSVGCDNSVPQLEMNRQLQMPQTVIGSRT